MNQVFSPLRLEGVRIWLRRHDRYHGINQIIQEVHAEIDLNLDVAIMLVHFVLMFFLLSVVIV